MRCYIIGKEALTISQSNKLDLEWIQLIIKAKELELTVEEIREFFKNKSDRLE